MRFSIIDHPAIGIPLFEETTISACSIDFRISMTSCHQKPHSSLVYQLGKAHFKPQTTAWSCPSCTKSIGSRHSHVAQHAAGTFGDLALSGVSDLGRAGWIKKRGKHGRSMDILDNAIASKHMNYSRGSMPSNMAIWKILYHPISIDFSYDENIHLKDFKEDIHWFFSHL